MRIGLPLAPESRVYAGFAIYSFCLGNIFPRLPDIQHAMGVREGALGLGLIGTPVGTLVALTFATPLIERIGFRRALLAAIPLMAAAFAIAVHAPDPLTLLPAAAAGRPDDRLDRDHPQRRGRPHRGAGRPAHHEPRAFVLEHRLLRRRAWPAARSRSSASRRSSIWR